MPRQARAGCEPRTGNFTSILLAPAGCQRRLRRWPAIWMIGGWRTLPELAAVIAATPTGNLAFLVTAFSKPFTSNGFGNWFRKQCDAAGISHCFAKGLRNAGAALAAENSATERQLMAIFDWSTIKDASRYTRAARQKVLAASGLKHLSRHGD